MGKADGNCAAGFGVCCTFTESTCGNTVSQNCSYIENPSFPTAYSTAGACEYTVSPLNSEICQLRLDFDNFGLGETATTGVCTDSFDVTVSSGRDYQTICGTLTGQKLTFTLAASGASATWRVKVSQMACYDAWKAPAGCYQYYTGVSGSLKSFNYPTVIIDEVIYTLCVRQEVGYCGIKWSAAATTSPTPFDIAHTISNPIISSIPATTAYIQIPGSDFLNYSGNGLSNDAEFATATLLDSTGSSVEASGQLFNVLVSTATNNCAIASDCVGFNLVWNQVPCDAS